MRWFGDGLTLWRVRVTLRAGRAQRSHLERLLERLRDMLSERPGEADPWDLCGELAMAGIHEATIGASFWVRAEDIGAAARLAVATMTSSLDAVTVERHSLYEINLVPADAVLMSSSG